MVTCPSGPISAAQAGKRTAVIQISSSPDLIVIIKVLSQDRAVQKPTKHLTERLLTPDYAPADTPSEIGQKPANKHGNENGNYYG